MTRPTEQQSTIIQAPFTAEQVEALNEFQEGGWMHPFTCGACRDGDLGEHLLVPDEHLLVATEDGWICPSCDYKQIWAHAFMTVGPPEWFRAFHTKPQVEPANPQNQSKEE